MLHLVALALYVVAGLLWLATLVRGERGEEEGTSAAPVVAGVAVVVHAGAAARYVVAFGELPLVGLAPSLSSLALVVALFLGGTLAFTEGEKVGLFLIPLIVVLQGVAVALGIEPAGEPLRFRGAWFALHVGLAFAGYAGLAVAFAAGLMYLIQFHELKTKRLGRVFRFFPPLETLDRIGRVGVRAGLPALTAALVLGWAWTVRFEGSFEIRDPKVLWGIFTWAVLLAALVARRGGGRASRRGALFSTVGFVAVVLSYVVLRATVVAGGTFF